MSWQAAQVRDAPAELVCTPVDPIDREHHLFHSMADDRFGRVESGKPVLNDLLQEQRFVTENAIGRMGADLHVESTPLENRAPNPEIGTERIVRRLVRHNLVDNVYGQTNGYRDPHVQAARLAGVPVNFVEVMVYVVMGLVTALGGLIMIARIDSTQATIGTAMEIHVISAVIIGGTSLFGGRGTIYSMTEVVRAPTPAFSSLVPYVLALVDLDDGVRVMAHAEPDLRIGERVELGFREHEGFALPYFTRPR